MAGELRVYLSTQHPIDLVVLQAAIGYSTACQREKHAEGDPWEWVLAATRDLPSEAAFDRERRRLTQILLNVLDEWQLDVLYYAPSRSLPSWGWSSTEGTLHPFRTIMAD